MRILFYCIVILCSLCMAGWIHTYGRTGIDAFNDVVALPDNEYVAVGYTNSIGSGGYDFWVMRFGAGGDSIWEYTYGGLYNDVAEAAALCSDGIIIVGSTTSFGVGTPGYTNVYAIKIDFDGELIWESTFESDLDDGASNIVVRDANTAIVCGYTWQDFSTYDDALLLFLSIEDGAVDSNIIVPGSNSDALFDVIATSSGYAAVGYTKSFGIGTPSFKNVYLLTSEPAEYSLGGTNTDEGKAIIEKDGDFIIAGNTASIGAGNGDMYLFKASPTGSIIWQSAFGGVNYDFGEDLIAVDNEFVCAGFSNSAGGAGYDDVFLVKADSTGGLVWQKRYGGTGNDHGNAIIATPDSGFIIVGSTMSYGAGMWDGFIIKTNADGDTFTDIIFNVDAYTDTQICQGTSAELMPIVDGGTPPYTCVWRDDSGTIFTDWHLYVTPETTTCYYLSVIDSTGFEATDSAIVTTSNPFAEAGHDTTILLGGAVVIGGYPAVIGGFPPYEYSWFPTTDLSNPFYSNPVATPTISTIYYLTVIDYLGCGEANYDSIMITVLGNVSETKIPEMPVFEAFPNPFNSSCNFIFDAPIQSGRILKIFSSDGKCIAEIPVERGQTYVTWKPQNIASGIYQAQIDNRQINIIYIK